MNINHVNYRECDDKINVYFKECKGICKLFTMWMKSLAFVFLRNVIILQSILLLRQYVLAMTEEERTFLASYCRTSKDCTEPKICVRYRCGKPRVIGQLCNHTGECKEPLVCIRFTCTKKRKEGQSCISQHHCELPLLCEDYSCRPLGIWF